MFCLTRRIFLQYPKRFLSTCSVKLSGTTFSNDNSGISNQNTVCLTHVLWCYKKSILKTEYISNNKDIDLDTGNHAHTLILTARPDQFEKLPPKCSSCGVILQTENHNHLGYVPQTKFIDSVNEKTLHKISCYNCFQLKSYNKGSGLRLTNGEVLNQLAHLKQQTALILFVVDMFDLEGTQIENLLETIGRRKRVIIVGNKVDKIPQDNKKASKQLEHMKDVLKDACYKYSLTKDCNFRDICLVSAKSGFGMLPLVEKITKHRDVNMDIYLIGCANTGKSTLYNLLVNLLNVHKYDEELPPQGIVHHLPGTTSSLVRHHISMRRLRRLRKRLANDPWEEEQEFTFDDEFLNSLQTKDPEPQQLQLNEKKKSAVQPLKVELVDEYAESKEEKQCYLYDTPGVFNDSQIIKHFNSSEINYLSPVKWIVSRTFLLKPGRSIFMGGFARLEYVDIHRPKVEDENEADDLNISTHSIFVTVMMSPNIPVHVTFTENEEESVEEKYKRLFINNVLELPKGSEERFNTFPPLLSRDYTIIGKNRNINACDLVLHGVGWLSVAAILEGRVRLSLYTPNGEGQGFRETPLLPYSVRNKEGRGIIYRGHLNRSMYGYTRKRSPQFIRLLEKQNQPTYLWKAKIREKLGHDRAQLKENRRLQRLQDGILLGKMKRLKEQEEKFKVLDDIKFKELKEKF